MPGAGGRAYTGGVWEIELGELDEKMGVTVLEQSAERVVATMPVEGNRQSFGLLHGGASVAFAEALGSWAAVIHARSLGKSAVGPRHQRDPSRAGAQRNRDRGGHRDPAGPHGDEPRDRRHAMTTAAGCARRGSRT